jgi:glutamate-5-semialdehyde dehydrogenase
MLQQIIKSLLSKNVAIHADQRSFSVLTKLDSKLIMPANDTDFKTEYLGLEICVLTVDSIQEAIKHINTFGSHHTDCIITEKKENSRQFFNGVDSAGVYLNASTRFADGYRYGFGAEVGVSTNKIHARGPVGLDGLVIYKYLIYGNGQCVSEYSKTKSFNFKDLTLQDH